MLGSTVSYGLGGRGANQAVAAARAGAIVAFVGRTGSDSQSGALRQAVRDFGVADDLLRTGEETTSGTAHITIEASGENQIIVVLGANGRVTTSDLPPEHPAAHEANVIVTQGEIPVEAMAGIVSLGRELGVEVVLNLAPAITVPRDVFNGLDALVVNETEAALVLNEEPPSSVADALAAADRLLALGSGMGFEECARPAVRAGSLAVQHVGAASGYPEFSLTSGIQEGSPPLQASNARTSGLSELP